MLIICSQYAHNMLIICSSYAHNRLVSLLQLLVAAPYYVLVQPKTACYLSSLVDHLILNTVIIFMQLLSEFLVPVL